jgi:Na+-transporting methylmalonyl-CoA/oxaloacetate decarboxylase gamma subunit
MMGIAELINFAGVIFVLLALLLLILVIRMHGRHREREGRDGSGIARTTTRNGESGEIDDAGT